MVEWLWIDSGHSPIAQILVQASVLKTSSRHLEEELLNLSEAKMGISLNEKIYPFLS